LIEEFACDSKAEPTAREAHYIRELDCVNERIPGRTRKEYYEKNKKEILIYHKKNYDDKKIKHTCECGGRYTNYGKETHEKTKKHQNYINSLN